MLIIILLILCVSIWYHWNHVPPEKNVQNLKKATDAAKYAALGAAVGIAAALKEEPGRRG